MRYTCCIKGREPSSSCGRGQRTECCFDHFQKVFLPQIAHLPFCLCTILSYSVVSIPYSRLSLWFLWYAGLGVCKRRYSLSLAKIWSRFFALYSALYSEHFLQTYEPFGTVVRGFLHLEHMLIKWAYHVSEVKTPSANGGGWNLPGYIPSRSGGRGHNPSP